MDDSEPDWLIAKNGLKLLINNDSSRAEELFLQYTERLPVFCGYSFAIFMDALMTFEEDKLTQAISLLKDVERRCTQDSSWFYSVRSRILGRQQIEKSLDAKLETEIILADSQVLLAILTFLQQDISGYFKGTWILRKAWKIYQNTYNFIFRLYVQRFGETSSGLPVVTDANRESITSLGSPSSSRNVRNNSLNGYTLKPLPNSYSAILHHNNSDDSPTSSGNSTPNSMKNNFSRIQSLLKKSQSVNSALYKEQQQWGNLTSTLNYLTSTLHIFPNSSSSSPSTSSTTTTLTPELDISDETLERLMGAVCFGYGLLHLGISLLPPTLLKLTNFLGFSTSRASGVQCLMYSRTGVDMRAPLATLALLWYHTIVRPFYAIDGANVQAGVDAASVLLEESEADYGQSALFLLFKGRVKRLNSDISGALECYQLSVEKTTQREVKILAMHEVGWCYLIQLDYHSAENTFRELKLCSRWSKNFYCYLEMICAGCCGHNQNINDLKKCMIMKGIKSNPIDEFLIRRSNILPDFNDHTIFWRLLLYELLYLWNSLSSCSTESIRSIIIPDCEGVENDNEPILGLASLILGACYSIENNFNKAIENFRKTIQIRNNIPLNSSDCHVSAFANYELGYILIRNPETKDEGKQILQQVYKFKGYDFENRLVLRVHSVLNHY